MAGNLRIRTLRSPMGWHSAAPSRSSTSCAHLQELRGPLGGGLHGRQRRGDVGQGHFLPAQGELPSAARRSEQLYRSVFSRPRRQLATHLGQTADGHDPGSIWQWDQFRALANLPDVVTGVLRQSDYGTAYQKPTRFLGHLAGLGQLLFTGWRGLNKIYSGPLPRFKWESHPP